MALVQWCCGASYFLAALLAIGFKVPSNGIDEGLGSNPVRRIDL